ncbi:11624_t:CDS:2 [Funneliformis geosporum]|uniref:7958_t:CDS:1 n=1 Tax=Funneliformis geosporum TaxID=1117311 RepID=A0A9W4WYT1_9GLOM|nr:7958_t:CDS:2 [Funneliformis geosporum]CAI2175345.1 11624_t:CDS:2 [Funneliformis geosporum]
MLEIISVVIGDGDFWFRSHGSASYYWLVIFMTYATLLYFMSSFSYRWITGPYKSEIYIDLFLSNLWIIVSLMNIISAFNGVKLTCDYPEDMSQRVRTTRCHLFLSSMSLGWIVTATFIYSSYISIMRWRKRPIEAVPPKFIEPPTVSHRPDTYLVQKGILADGQPVLFFHMAQKNSNSNLTSAKWGESGNVTPSATGSNNASNSNINDYTGNQHTASSSRASIYLRGKDTTEV